MRRVTSSRSALSTVPALALAAVLATVMALPAGAQQTNMPAHPPAQAPAQRLSPPEQMAQQRLANLRQRLRITPAEQGAWDQFEQASMRNSAAIDAAFRARAEQVPSMNAVQNMQSFADIESKRAQDMQGLVPDFQKLYAALSPQQQKTADELFREVTERAHARAMKRH